MPSCRPVRIAAYTAVTALGAGKSAQTQAFLANRSGLTRLDAHDFGASPLSTPLATWVGHVDGLDDPLPSKWTPWDCRNNRLAWMGLQSDGFAQAVRQAAEKHGRHRVAVVLGTSTGSIGATEAAYLAQANTGTFPWQASQRRLHSLHALSAFVQEALDLQGPCQTISTACSSSAKAFAAGERLLRLGLADAVVVGGVDTLCGSVVFGFHALQLVSPDPCRPFDAQRQGINLGEAAAFVLLDRDPEGPQLLGHGESSDAHHLTAPQPDGRAAGQALHTALDRAGLSAGDIDLLLAHGTATPKNDAIEAALIARHFPHHTRVSATKGWVGHTLGASGALSAVYGLLALDTGILPGSAHTHEPESNIAPYLLLETAQQPVHTVVSNAFAFGGSNCVLIFAAAPRTA